MYRLYIKKNINSEKILKEVLNKENIFNYEIVYNEYHKPYLKDNSLYFNISHTKDIVVIAVSDKEIGVDIQYLTYKENVLNRVYNDKEIELAKDNKYLFTKIWVMKEAYAKLKGQGISYNLKNIDTLKLEKEFDIIDLDAYLIAVVEKR